jgi:hypothetical protein
MLLASTTNMFYRSIKKNVVNFEIFRITNLQLFDTSMKHFTLSPTL